MLSFFCCKKNDTLPDYYNGEVSAIQNNINWSADIYSLENEPYGQGIDIIIDRFNELNIHRERIFLYKIPKNIGKYYLSNTDPRDIDSLSGSSYHTSLYDGDVSGDSYDLLTSDEIIDYVEISKVDNDKIEGTFQISFLRDTTYGIADPTASDTLVFLNGEFNTRIVEF